MKKLESFYIYNAMKGKTLIYSKFNALEECFKSLKDKKDSIPGESYLAIGINYISDNGMPCSNDFLKYNSGNFEIANQVIDKTNITAIPQICDNLDKCITNFKK